jgi:hypothetical protein
MADFQTELEGRIIGFDDKYVSSLGENEWVKHGIETGIGDFSQNQEAFLRYVHKICKERTAEPTQQKATEDTAGEYVNDEGVD